MDGRRKYTLQQLIDLLNNSKLNIGYLNKNSDIAKKALKILSGRNGFVKCVHKKNKEPTYQITKLALLMRK